MRGGGAIAQLPTSGPTTHITHTTAGIGTRCTLLVKGRGRRMPRMQKQRRANMRNHSEPTSTLSVRSNIPAATYDSDDKPDTTLGNVPPIWFVEKSRNLRTKTGKTGPNRRHVRATCAQGRQLPQGPDQGMLPACAAIAGAFTYWMILFPQTGPPGSQAGTDKHATANREHHSSEASATCIRQRQPRTRTLMRSGCPSYWEGSLAGPCCSVRCACGGPRAQNVNATQ